MKVGDLVQVVQSESCTLHTPFEGQVGVIINVCLAKSKEQDRFVVLTRNCTLIFGPSYLEVIHESR